MNTLRDYETETLMDLLDHLEDKLWRAREPERMEELENRIFQIDEELERRGF